MHGPPQLSLLIRRLDDFGGIGGSRGMNSGSAKRASQMQRKAQQTDPPAEIVAADMVIHWMGSLTKLIVLLVCHRVVQ